MTWVKTKKQFSCRMADVIFHVHDYRAGQIEGWLSHPRLPQPVRIDSVPQLLFVLDDVLERESRPMEFPNYQAAPMPGTPMATLRLQILFREHYTWQGLVIWEDQQRQATFLSALELVKLLDEILGD